MLDLNQQKDAHIVERLQQAPIIWLSTVRPDNRPHLVPVWFLWENPTLLIFSEPENQKIRNLRNNPHVMLALETLEQGGDVVMIEGTAVLEGTSASQATAARYAEKYAQQIQEMSWQFDTMIQRYSQAIRITPQKFIFWE